MRSSIIWVALGNVVVLFGGSLSAQDPFGEFGAPPPTTKQAPAAPDAAQGQDAATAKQAASKEGRGAQKSAPAIDPSRYSLPIRAVLESNPQTPAELIRTASVLVDLDEPDLAKRYVLKLQEAALDDAALAELVRRLGSGPFLKIAAEKKLEPEGRELADRAIQAAGKHARDPARLAQLVEQLGAASAETQRRAIVEILYAHEHAVPPLLTALGDPAKKAVHRRANEALIALSDDAIAPLTAMLDAPDGPAKAAAIRAIGRIGSTQATPPLVGLYAAPTISEQVRNAAEDALLDLYGKLPSRGEAVRYLEHMTRAFLAGEEQLPTNADGEVQLWLWDAGKSQPVPATLSVNQARSQLADRLARRLYELAPDRGEHRRLYLVSTLEAEGYRAGLDVPVSREKGSAFAAAATMGPDAIEDALGYAIDHGHAAAATVAAQIIGEIGSSGMLVRGGGQSSPLAKALVHDDRRVRFAATQAIVDLRPTAPFPGASDLQRALVYFATSAGQRRALVGFPNAETAQKLAGMVNSLGLEANTATNGRDLLLNATQSGDYEVIVVSSRIDRGPLYLVLQNLRKHAHTAQTPLIVLAEDDETGSLRETMHRDALTTVVLRPRDLAGMKYAVEQSLRRAADRIVSRAVRERQAKDALRSIAELSEAAPKVFDFRSDEKQLAPLVYLPSLGAPAAAVLAQFGTHTSQRSLLEIANRTSQPLSSRQAAALAFGASVRRFGVRLTKEGILKQYDRYNQSQSEDRTTQDLLGVVLDAIELPSTTQAQVGKAGRAER